MSSYVNLMQPSEIKYHSVATDKRFLIKAGIGLALLFGLYVAWTVLGSMAAARDARQIQSEWEDIKPKHAAAIQQNQTLVKLRGTRAYLESWGESRVPTAHLLLELTALLPPTVQATQIQITSQILGLEGGVVRLGQTEIKTPERVYKLQFKGLSHGAEGEKTVFQLVEEMKNSPALSQWLASVKLQDAQKEYLTPEGAPAPGGAPLASATMTEEQLFGSAGKAPSPGAGAATPEKPAEPLSATAFTIECEFKPRVFAWPGKS